MTSPQNWLALQTYEQACKVRDAALAELGESPKRTVSFCYQDEATYDREDAAIEAWRARKSEIEAPVRMAYKNIDLLDLPAGCHVSVNTSRHGYDGELIRVTDRNYRIQKTDMWERRRENEKPINVPRDAEITERSIYLVQGRFFRFQLLHTPTQYAQLRADLRVEQERKQAEREQQERERAEQQAQKEAEREQKAVEARAKTERIEALLERFRALGIEVKPTMSVLPGIDPNFYGIKLDEIAAETILNRLEVR